MTRGNTVYLVDDDVSVREAITELLSTHGMRVVSFGSATEYLSSGRVESPACLLLDVNLPDINGLQLQKELADGRHPPIIFISGHGDIPSTVQAMKAGAVDFLPKPCNETQLLAAIDAAISRHREWLKVQSDLDALRSRHESLTPREREVFPLVVSGMLNKQAAAKLGISEVTLQIHRGQVMRKMEARSLAELVRMAVRLGICDAETSNSPPVG
jgi:FixJ family two-component response regulator